MIVGLASPTLVLYPLHGELVAAHSSLIFRGVLPLNMIRMAQPREIKYTRALGPRLHVKMTLV